MATDSFLHRWSKRKQDVAEEEAKSELPQSIEPEIAPDTVQNVDTTDTEEDEPVPSMEDVERLREGDSAALFLAKGVSSQVKKAALRKLFHSEAYNIRDGLNEYDLDYTKGESLSAEIAQTLRQWTKEKLEQSDEAQEADGTHVQSEGVPESEMETDQQASVQSDGTGASPDDETKSTHAKKGDNLS